MKTALITGGASGLGRKISEALLDDGFRVFITYHNSSPTELQQKYSGRVKAVRLDLTRLESAPEAVAAFRTWSDSLNLFVHNASVFAKIGLLDIAPGQWDQYQNIHYSTPLHIVRSLFEHFDPAANNLCLFISDIYSQRPMLNHAAYGVSKGMVIENLPALTRLLASRNVRINVLCPGILQADGRAYDPALLDRIPLGRYGSYPDIVNLVLRLYSDYRYVNGQALAVDGGRSLVF